jgi:hypothetical protein
LLIVVTLVSPACAPIPWIPIPSALPPPTNTTTSLPLTETLKPPRLQPILRYSVPHVDGDAYPHRDRNKHTNFYAAANIDGGFYSDSHRNKHANFYTCPYASSKPSKNPNFGRLADCQPCFFSWISRRMGLFSLGRICKLTDQ